jgi:outer membrane protein
MSLASSRLHGVVVLAALFVVVRSAGADPSADVPSIPTFTLDEALAYARAHQPQIRGALSELAARRADALVPRARWLPQIGATAQAFVSTNNNSSAVFLSLDEVDVPRTGGTPGRTVGTTRWTPAGSTIAAVSLDQEVYDFGRISAATAIADAAAAVAHADAKAAELDVDFAVEEAFHGVLAAKAVLSATSDAEKRAASHRDYAQAGTKSGLFPPIQLTRAQADVALLEVRLVRAHSGLDIARAALAAAMGHGELEVDAAPVAPDEAPSPGLEAVLRMAARDNPAIVAALSRLDEQRATTRELTRELFPDLLASAGLSGRAGGEVVSDGARPYGNGWLPDIANWHVGLVLRWSVFDATVLARRRASAIRERARQAQLELTRLSTTLGAERAFLELDAAIKAVPALTESVAAARANQAQAEARFRAGLGTVVELADAEAVLTSSELELAIGEYAVSHERAALGRVMGDMLAAKRNDAGRKP